MQTALSHPAACPPEAEARLRAYAALLLRWTRRINLVSRGDETLLWERHVLDCLRLAPFIPAGMLTGGRAIDLGSGAGLPGLVLAVATGVRFELVESDRRKAAFLQEAIRVTQAPATVRCARIEDSGLAPAGLITARALAQLPALLELATPLLAPGGTMLFLKGAKAAEEVAAARRTWRFGLRMVGTLASPILCITDPVREVAHG